MSKHEDLIKTLRASAAAMPFDAAVAVQYRDAADALEDQAREIADMQQQESELCTLHAMAEAECKKLRAEIEGLRKDAYRAEQLEQLARYMFEADNDYGVGFSSDPNWRLWYTRLADLVGVKLESAP